MRYLKLFEETEDIDFKYKNGDYVLLSTEGPKWNVERECKILKKLMKKGEPGYRVETHRVPDGLLTDFWIDEDEIERKLTKEEIEEYLLNQEIKKYNL